LLLWGLFWVWGVAGAGKPGLRLIGVNQ